MRLAEIQPEDEPTILHVGAGIGQEIEAYRQWNAKIVCVEGDSSNAEVIGEKYPDVVCLQKIVSDRAGVRPWYSTVPLECSSLHPLDKDIAKKRFRSIRTHTTIPVAVVAIDMLNLPPIDVMVTDVQGHDYEVLLGALKTLENCKLVICEAWLKPLYKGTKLLPEIEKYMNEQGFTLRHFQPGSTPDFWGDAIFTRRN